MSHPSEPSLYFKSCPSPYVSSSNQVNISLVLPSAPKDSSPPPTIRVQRGEVAVGK